VSHATDGEAALGTLTGALGPMDGLVNSHAVAPTSDCCGPLKRNGIRPSRSTLGRCSPVEWRTISCRARSGRLDIERATHVRACAPLFWRKLRLARRRFERMIKLLTIGEHADLADKARRRRPRLSLNEKQEIARLYADAGTPTSDIRDRFGLGESSLYRVLKEYGVPLRGRTPSQAKAAARVGFRAGGTRRSTRRSAQPPDAVRSGLNGRKGTASTPNATTKRFLVRFSVDQVFVATDIHDVLRQVDALCVADVVSIVRAG
jgi:transposase-like protein